MKKAVLAICTAIGLAMISTAFSAPKGLRDAEVGKKLYKFNVIVKPNNWEEGGNACNGARIFFDAEGGTAALGTLLWDLDPSALKRFQITDCDGTDGSATVTLDENTGDFLVAIRVLGKNHTKVDYDCLNLAGTNSFVDDINDANEDLCVIDNVDVHKGNTFTKVLKNIADGEHEGVLWTWDSTSTFKIFEARILEYNP